MRTNHARCCRLFGSTECRPPDVRLYRMYRMDAGGRDSVEPRRRGCAWKVRLSEPAVYLSHETSCYITLGWHVARQRGSHIILVKTGSIATLSIPDHKEVARGTLRGLIRAADMLVDDFNTTAGQVL